MKTKLNILEKIPPGPVHFAPLALNKKKLTSALVLARASNISGTTSPWLHISTLNIPKLLKASQEHLLLFLGRELVPVESVCLV